MKALESLDTYYLGALLASVLETLDVFGTESPEHARLAETAAACLDRFDLCQCPREPWSDPECLNHGVAAGEFRARAANLNPEPETEGNYGHE